MSFYRKQLEDYLSRLIVKAETVLDIGGSAYPVSKRVKVWNVKTYDILDNNNEKGLHDKWEPPKFTIDIQEEMPFNPNYYEYIFMLEVAEYLYDPYQALANIHTLLNNGGTFVSSWPFVYPIHQPQASDMLRYVPTGLQTLFSKVGFSEIEMTPRFGSEKLVEFYRQDGMRMAKGFDHTVTGCIIKCTK